MTYLNRVLDFTYKTHDR